MDQTKQAANFKADARLIIRAKDANKTVVFNEETARLCRRVDESGSIYSAAAEAGMSYGKVWRLVKNIEDALGFPLFSRGGCKGSTLTSEGRELLATWTEIQQRTEARADELLQKDFSNRKIILD